MNAKERATDKRSQVSADEWQTRVDLAACYRLVAAQGWDDLVFTHITARLPKSDVTFSSTRMACCSRKGMPLGWSRSI
jgi:ribulose-5-phosphate 4-epimerase/fuculose-1-phosphate aldolase